MINACTGDPKAYEGYISYHCALFLPVSQPVNNVVKSETVLFIVHLKHKLTYINHKHL